MAVTGAIFKALTFNGETSRDFGVYITGEAVYNAPTRDVEMVTIPGRNGSFALDHGRFENIEVTYPAGVYADNEQDFAAAISDFRNMLCAAQGYCRLEDDYNPDEYRLAIYKSGLEVEPAALKAGEFEITFECKPQRYLKTGEDPIAIGASTAITNPTRFESSPELKVKGYGAIAFNGYDINIQNAIYGDVILRENVTLKYDYLNLHSDEYANNGDKITLVTSPEVQIREVGWYFIDNVNITTATPSGEAYAGSSKCGFRNSTFLFTKGTAGSETAQIDASMTVYDLSTEPSPYFSATMTIRFDINYIPATDKIQFTTTVTTTPGSILDVTKIRYRINKAMVHGTKSTLGNPTIIDCETGEAYKETADGAISLNAYVDLGAELPKLAAGPDTVTTENTITECELIPRWWKI